MLLDLGLNYKTAKCLNLKPGTSAASRTTLLRYITVPTKKLQLL